jgi:phage FluMu gp28-like protein
MTTHDVHSDLLKSDAANATAPPVVLLQYQQAWVADTSQLKIAEKSRRIGLTWAEASDDTLEAAAQGGSNTFYIGPTQDMSVEFIEACAMWARAYDIAASEIEEGIFIDSGAGQDGADKAIKTYKIDFPHTGRRIVALSSRPTNLRGKQGNIVIDEAAFHNDLSALLKAAMAMLLWGNKVRIISTHDGVDNQFNELIQEVRAKKRKGSLHRITFRDAVAQGLYRRVCLRRGIEWTEEGESQWVKDAYDFYAEDAAEELDVIPSQGGGAFLTLALIESAMSPDTPIVRKRFNQSFNLQAEHERRAIVDAWLHETLDPILLTLDPLCWHAFGEDFGRVSDLTAIVVGEESKTLVTRVRFIVELSNCPFSQQEQILFYIVERLPRLRAGAMDATGNGASLAEKAADKFGGTKIEQVKLSESFYLENFPPLKGAIEDATFTALPRDREVRDDLRAIRLINGVPKLPNFKTQRGDGQKATRHGDVAIACMMLHYAMKRDVVDIRGVQAGVRWRESGSLDGFFSE